MSPKSEYHTAKLFLQGPPQNVLKPMGTAKSSMFRCTCRCCWLLLDSCLWSWCHTAIAASRRKPAKTSPPSIWFAATLQVHDYVGQHRAATAAIRAYTKRPRPPARSAPPPPPPPPTPTPPQTPHHPTHTHTQTTADCSDSLDGLLQQI